MKRVDIIAKTIRRHSHAIEVDLLAEFIDNAIVGDIDAQVGTAFNEGYDEGWGSGYSAGLEDGYNAGLQDEA